MSIEVETAEEIKQRLEAAKQQDQVDNNKDLSTEENQEQEERKTIRLPLSQRLEIAYNNLNETEKNAWTQGWRPEEFFAGKNKDGSQRKWVNAETFLSNSKDTLPVANERIKDLTARIEKAEREAKEARERVEKAEKMGYEKALQDLAKKQREAVELGDIDAFDNLKEQENEIIKNQYSSSEIKQVDNAVIDNMVQNPNSPPPPPSQEARKFSEAETAQIADFYARNSWMKTDPNIAEYAVYKESKLLHERPYLSVKERLDIVEEDVKNTFHQKLNGSQNSSMFDSPSGQGFGEPTTQKAKGYNDMTAEMRKHCENIIKIRGIQHKGFKGLKGEDALKAFRQEYAKSHFSFN